MKLGKSYLKEGISICAVAHKDSAFMYFDEGKGQKCMEQYHS